MPLSISAATISSIIAIECLLSKPSFSKVTFKGLSTKGLAMELSILLFRLFGFLWVIIGAAYILRHEQIRATMQDFYKNYALIMVIAFINLLLGLLVALNFSHWELNARGFITLIAYLMILKGIMHLYFPEWGRKIISYFNDKNTIVITGVIVTLLGLWLLYEGYYR